MVASLEKYPIGQFEKPSELTKEWLTKYILAIESFPIRLRKLVDKMDEKQLEATYRKGGWTIRQVINHCADSHINSFIRFKLALTEDSPIIKPYFEERWAELEDSKNMPIEPALLMLDGLHARWAVLLKSLSDLQLSRCFVHPEHGRAFRLDENIGMYAWHCNHHLAHVERAMEGIGIR